jgi:hypothetical protein
VRPVPRVVRVRPRGANARADLRLFDERPCERGRRSANAEDFPGKLLIVGRLAGTR